MVPASLQYERPGVLNTVLLGGNYRDLWAIPVKLPVFHLKAKGFKVKELGGGNQTLSLQLTDAQGQPWVLRTVEKEVTKALPPLLAKTFVLSLVQQQVSGSHPYAPLVVAPLSKAVGVRGAEPVFYFIPDDPDFGEFRSQFAGTVCLLEQREAGESKTLNSEKALERIIDKGSARPEASSLLKARMLDLFIGDWDRHAGQWRWAERPGGLLQALPRDRDQAFFFTNGVLPRLFQAAALKYLVSFEDDLRNWRGITFKSWPFDRFFLSELDRSQWLHTLESMQASLTDSVLENAVRAMPPEIQARNGDRLLRQLKGRRDALTRTGMRYYHFLSGYVDVYGSDKDEEFVVTGSGDSVRVQVFALNGGQRGRQLYNRRFVREETRLLRLWAFHGNDKFSIAPGKSRFRFELNADDGDDEYATGGDKRVRRMSSRPARKVPVLLQPAASPASGQR
ncbi:MAG: hypothetical protein EOO08_05190 [Chitinophagaceae bacterium]|nr:MAG: hypothetical protein EOO08_05190 [Chitinophagaceae bacterium]